MLFLSIMIDLHCHSHFSDGLHSPEYLVEKAIASNVKLLALTDHDTLDGVSSLHTAAQDRDITIINGIELSTRWKKYDIHVLGYLINPDNKDLVRLIDQQNQSRINRALEIGQRLQSAGINDAYTKACELAGHRRVGRPHFAQVIVREGLAVDMKMSFKRFLGRGKPAYIPTPWISMSQAVAAINQADGLAVLAHPLKYDLTRTRLHELVCEFKEAGGLGLEVVSGEMGKDEITALAGLCLRYQLQASTGSDFHGESVSRISLGRQRQLPLNCTPIWDQWGI
ncbi:metal dependent phosphoesterase [Legionella spiritensis]|nr:metal dependent phosphoesterase [Legionella spiritensis]